MSVHTTEHNGDRDVPELSCPACIEAASQKRGEEELVPIYALIKYTFDQLVAHLESDVHDHREFVDVALRASISLYRHAFAHYFEELEGVQ